MKPRVTVNMRAPAQSNESGFHVPKACVSDLLPSLTPRETCESEKYALRKAFAA